MDRDNLTNKQKDYAIFLPALSGFYASYIGKQRHDPEHVPADRMPDQIPDMEQLNWLNSQKALFPYRWSLYSAGHANLDLNKPDAAEDMVRNRDPDAIVVGDSGGFQIAKGVWEGVWSAPGSPEFLKLEADCKRRKTEVRPVTIKVTKDGKKTDQPVLDSQGNPKMVTVDLVKEFNDKVAMAQKKRDGVLRWMDGVMNYGMILDTPAWVSQTPVGAKIGITHPDHAVNATKYNNEYWIKHRKGVEAGGAKLLNVLQGVHHDDAINWYETMKVYCDPTLYPERHFDGWAMGGQPKTDADLMLKLLVHIRWDGLMEQGKQDWLHVLGTSKLEYALLLTNIQRAIRKHVNPDFTVSYDCASPFLATANGQIYHHADLSSDQRWSYRMSKSIDDKKYATDSRSLRDVAMTDYHQHFKHFDESPVSARLKISDICIYKPGVPKSQYELGDGVAFDFKNPEHYHVVPDLNKIDKIGRTSWDSFSYALQMAHNVWTHIHAVQEANRRHDTPVDALPLGVPGHPKSMQWSTGDYAKCRDIVDRIFDAASREDALKIIEDYKYYWIEIVGSFGNNGKKAINALAQFDVLFETVDDGPDNDGDIGDDLVFDEDSLENLEIDQED